MRIIAGTARSLPLKTIEGLETRPTTDKIKETLFNMLQNDVPGCYFLDLFAGSGQIGLEAISRGALYAVFIENNRKAAKCIEDNIAFTKFTKESRLLTTDVISGISSLEGKYTFDIIFMDPPYAGGFYEPVLKEILNAGILSIKICISIIPISAATIKAIIYIKTLQNVFAIFLYITKSFLAYFGKKKDVSIRHTLFHIFLFHWNESHIFYSLLSCLSKDNIQECLLNICRIP